MSRAWMPLYVADYIADTGHLSTLEHGAYMLLIMHYWQNGGLPTDDKRIARVVRLPFDEWMEIREAISELFNEGWRHKRIDAELAKTDAIISKRSAAGKAGASARYGNRMANATDLPYQTHGQSQSQSQEDKATPLSETSSDDGDVPIKRRRESYSPDFEAFWKAYPTDSLMSKKAASDAWKRLDESARTEVMASLPAFKAYCASKPDYRPVHAVRYITQRRSEGFIQVASKASEQTFVEKGTPEWEAWQKVRKVPPVRSETHHTEGWWFPTRWPQQDGATA